MHSHNLFIISLVLSSSNNDRQSWLVAMVMYIEGVLL